MSKKVNFELQFATSKTHMLGSEYMGWNIHILKIRPVYQSEPILGSRPKPVYKLEQKIGFKTNFFACYNFWIIGELDSSLQPYAWVLYWLIKRPKITLPLKVFEQYSYPFIIMDCKNYPTRLCLDLPS